MSFEIAREEEVRLAALRAYEILDTPPEESFDEVARLAALVCGTAHAGVSLIDREREWFKAHVGWDARESPWQGSLCEAALRQSDVFVIADAAADERFKGTALVAKKPSARFYACQPLRTRMGVKLGTLCVFDPTPRHEGLTELQRFALRTLGNQLEAQLELRLGLRALESRESELKTERSALVNHQVEQQRITAAVTHDLKSPLTAMLLGTRLLSREPGLTQMGRDVARELEEAAEDMQRKILDLVDVDRAAHGGLQVEASEIDLADAAAGACRMMERRARARQQSLRLEASKAPARGDHALVVRVLQNILDNALRHSPAGSEIVVEAKVALGEGAEVRVRDQGPPLPASIRTRIFEPNLAGEGGRQSTGLGLAFSKAAIETMGGRVWVEDTARVGATFCIWLPPP